MEIFINFFFDKLIDTYLSSSVRELFNLVIGVDFNLVEKLKSPSILQHDPYYLANWGGTLNDYHNTTTVYIVLQSFSYLGKIAVALNIFLVKLVFFWVTTLTFWLLPSFTLFLAGIFCLFSINPKGVNLWVWYWTKNLFLVTFIYQIILIYIYLLFLDTGLLLKVGGTGIFFLPINIFLAKLIAFLLIISSLYFTASVYIFFYKKNIILVKPELCSILCFLGFSTGMVFFQNDLFAIFLYFEIISFCIYGLLFLHKRTNVQLYALIRYVLFSLWISTCYIIGTVLYISAENNSTSLLAFKHGVASGHYYKVLDDFHYRDFDFIILQDAEFILGLIFILIYFFFKLGVGPFYTWTVEVYNSCPTSTLFVVSTLPKLVYIPVLFFVLYYNFFDYLNFWCFILFTFGLLTIFIGAFGILLTDKLKEIYAWSSIVHTGNILIIVSSVSATSLSFVMFYLTSYYFISCGFILLILSLRNKITGRFIKVISELNSISYLFGNIYFLAIIVLASASGFTPFISFFMKFSVLYLTTFSYGLPLALIIGLLNIIGGVAYLRMLWNIIGFNLDSYSNRFNAQNNGFVDVHLSYNFALLFNLICLLIIFSFFFYKDFTQLFKFYDVVIHVDRGPGTDVFLFIHAQNVCEVFSKISQFVFITKPWNE